MSFLKTYKAQESFRGSEAKTWMLSIVRNTAMDFLRRVKTSGAVTLDENAHEPEDHSPDPERALLEQSRWSVWDGLTRWILSIQERAKCARSCLPQVARS